MYDSAFTPTGPTVLIGNNAWVQAPPTSGQSGSNTSYRIANITAARQYLLWTPGVNGGTAPAAITPSSPPTAGAPSVNTVGMLATSIETFTLPAFCWFISSTAAAIEVTPGEGV